MTQCHIPAEMNVQECCCESSKSHVTWMFQKEFCIRNRQVLRFNINNLVYLWSTFIMWNFKRLIAQQTVLHWNTKILCQNAINNIKIGWLMYWKGFNVDYLNKTLSWLLPKHTEKNHDKHHSGWLVAKPSVKAGTPPEKWRVLLPCQPAQSELINDTHFMHLIISYLEHLW